jgi:hypothetical protein
VGVEDMAGSVVACLDGKLLEREKGSYAAAGN